MPKPALRLRGPDSWVERNRWLSPNPSLSPSRSCLQSRTWELLSKFSKPPGEVPVVWAVTLGWDHRACRVKLNLQVPASCISAHRQLQQIVHADAPWTSSLPKLQIQTSQMDLSSWKSLYIPTLTLCQQEQFQSCLLRELLNDSEPGSAPGVASFCWFVSGQPAGALRNWSGASAMQVWAWSGRECSQENTGRSPGRRGCAYGLRLPASLLRPWYGTRILGEATKPWKLECQEEKWLKMPKLWVDLIEETIFNYSYSSIFHNGKPLESIQFNQWLLVPMCLGLC